VKTSKTIVTNAIASLIAAGAIAASTVANAAKHQAPAAAAAATEKCYGVAKAGKNDCQTATSSCAGTSKTDNQKDAWITVPKGTCEKLVGGSLQAAKK
jgi:uncharacterized membrane protein